MRHYKKCFCNPNLPGTERRAPLSILRIWSIQWCALSPFICAIFRGSGEWSDERGATKASPSREADERPFQPFFYPGFVFCSFSFSSFFGLFWLPGNVTFLHQCILWNNLLTLMIWILSISAPSGHTASNHNGVKTSSVQNPGTEPICWSHPGSVRELTCSSAPQMPEWFCLSGRFFLAFYFACIM